MKFNEDSRVKIPTILHLMRLGYGYLSLKDPKVTWDESTNIFTGIFLHNTKRLRISRVRYNFLKAFTFLIRIIKDLLILQLYGNNYGKSSFSL
jgi:hypothetical protein